MGDPAAFQELSALELQEHLEDAQGTEKVTSSAGPLLLSWVWLLGLQEPMATWQELQRDSSVQEQLLLKEQQDSGHCLQMPG